MTKRKDEWVTITEAAEALQCNRSAFSELFLGPSWWCRRVNYMPSKYGWRWELSRSLVASLPELCRGYGLTMKHIRAAVGRLDSDEYTDTAGLKEQIKGYRFVLESEVARLESALTVQASYLYDFKETMDSLQEYKERAMHLELEVSALTKLTEYQERSIERLSKRCNEAKKQTEDTKDKPKRSMVTLHEAASASNRSVQTIRRWIKSGDLTRYEGAAPARGGSRCALVDREELFTLLDNRNEIQEKFATVNGTTSEHKAQIEGLKTRLAAAEKERDQAITARDKWAADHARQRKEIEALKLELQTYADTYAGLRPPALIDCLVVAVESAPLETLMQIDKPRHAALRRVVHLWTAVQHAVESFTPGDSAQTNNNDEVT